MDLISISLTKKFPEAVTYVFKQKKIGETNHCSSYRDVFYIRHSAYLIKTKGLFVSSRKSSNVKSPL